MHAAARVGHADILTLLLDHGANLEEESGPFRQTPLHLTSSNRRLEAAQCLIDLGADINARDIDDWTPLRWAVARENTQAVRLLLEQGADVSASDNSGRTPSQAARELLAAQASSPSTSIQEIVGLLSEYGAKSVE
jgi:ankyrin repeat protein